NDLWRNGMESVDTGGVLYRNRCDRGHGIAGQCAHRFDVGLDAGAAAGIGTRDNQHAGGVLHRCLVGGSAPSPCPLPRWGEGFYVVASRMSWATSLTTARTSFSLSPSPMMRMTGSVPDLRTKSRPPSSFFSHSLIAEETLGSLSGEPFL